MARVKLR